MGEFLALAITLATWSLFSLYVWFLRQRISKHLSLNFIVKNELNGGEDITDILYRFRFKLTFAAILFVISIWLTSTVWENTATEYIAPEATPLLQKGPESFEFNEVPERETLEEKADRITREAEEDRKDR